jgi:hypothetical protein
MDIIKPQNDNRIYKYYVLENNIKCILINDKDIDKSYVVTSVNTGSGVLASRHRPWALAYSLTRATRSGSRPVNSR